MTICLYAELVLWSKLPFKQSALAGSKCLELQIALLCSYTNILHQKLTTHPNNSMSFVVSEANNERLTFSNVVVILLADGQEDDGPGGQ